MKSFSRVERRCHCRFPVAVPLEYASPDHRGQATTVDLSGHGVLLVTADPLPIGERLQVSLHWPSLPDGQDQLRLEATGRVLRRAENGVVVSLIGGTFRFCRKHLVSNPIEVSDDGPGASHRPAGEGAGSAAHFEQDTPHDSCPL